MKPRPHFLLLLWIGIATLPSAHAQSATEPATGINWQSFQDGLSSSKESSTKLLVDVYAPWCGWCSRLQADVYSTSQVRSYVNEHFTVARLNIDEMDDTLSFKGYTLSSGELAMGLGASGTPTTVFLDTDGDYITRLPGYLGPEEFLTVLRFIATDAYLTKSFEEFAGL
ncbi:MAG: thioredoxin fold domain-containing protein [Rhodothermia bacterium]|nr:thioredoxin fold domain-containing protein [Rhodothermia bacterium]